MYDDSIQNEYFNWLCKKAIDNPRQRDHMSDLLTRLYQLEFLPMLDDDFNRWSNGADVKYRFAWECEYSYSTVDDEIPRRCSMLELLVSLAFIIEDRFMAEMGTISQESRWFLQMLESLGLSEYTNDYFLEGEIERRIDRFNKREYERNGKGGLFTFKDPQEDQREVVIWKQLTMHCTEMLLLDL